MTTANPPQAGAQERRLRAVSGSGSDHLTRERLRFDHPSELLVYDALRRAQDARDPLDTIAISSRVWLRVRGHTFRLDLLVTYRGRVGAIEVDGASHYGKWSSDCSRDYLIADCGIPVVYHIDVDDAHDAAGMDEHVRRFLRMMGA